MLLQCTAQCGVQFGFLVPLFNAGPDYGGRSIESDLENSPSNGYSSVGVPEVMNG